MGTLHGTPSWPLLEAAGEITVDKMGSISASVIYKIPPGRVDLMPGRGFQHPLVPSMGMENYKLMPRPGLWRVKCEFAGAAWEFGGEQAVYELHKGGGEEPIETHEDFISTIGGKPSAPLHGAVFVDEEGMPTTDDLRGVFERFAMFLDEEGTENPLRGQDSYLEANMTMWSKRWTDRTPFTSSELNRVMKIDSPPGNPPTPSGYNWLKLGADQTERGGKDPQSGKPYGYQKMMAWRMGRWKTGVYGA